MKHTIAPAEFSFFRAGFFQRNFSENKFSLLLSIILFIIINLFSCAPGRLSQKKITEIKKGEHSYLVFTMPSKEETETNINWWVNVNLDNELFFNDIFKQGETYRIPIPAGRHKISYRIYARSIKPFRGQTTYITGESAYMPFNNLEINAKKDHIISFSFKKKGDRLVKWLDSCYYTITAPVMWPLGFWPIFRQPMQLTLEKDEYPFGDKKAAISPGASETAHKRLIFGSISEFKSENKVLLSIKKKFLELLHPGKIILVFKNNRIAGKLVVTQIFQTNIIAKIILSNRVLTLGMRYGIMNTLK